MLSNSQDSKCKCASCLSKFLNREAYFPAQPFLSRGTTLDAGMLHTGTAEKICLKSVKEYKWPALVCRLQDGLFWLEGCKSRAVTLAEWLLATSSMGWSFCWLCSRIWSCPLQRRSRLPADWKELWLMPRTAFFVDGNVGFVGVFCCLIYFPTPC